MGVRDDPGKWVLTGYSQVAEHLEPGE